MKCHHVNTAFNLSGHTHTKHTHARTHTHTHNTHNTHNTHTHNTPTHNTPTHWNVHESFAEYDPTKARERNVSVSMIPVSMSVSI